MENEQMNQKPTYEQLVQAYNNAVRMLDQAQREIESLKADSILHRLEVLLHIFEHKDNYSNKVIKLAEWHLEQLLAKPQPEQVK